MTDLKSKWRSKTFVTNVLLSVFGLLVAVGLLPEGLDGNVIVGTLVAVGGGLGALFRKRATTELV